jgi:FixJ family two-component response regulator
VTRCGAENGRSGPFRNFCSAVPASKIHFISGYTGVVVLLEEARSSHLDFIQKPFGPFELDRKVGNCLDE